MVNIGPFPGSNSIARASLVNCAFGLDCLASKRYIPLRPVWWALSPPYHRGTSVPVVLTRARTTPIEEMFVVVLKIILIHARAARLATLQRLAPMPNGESTVTPGGCNTDLERRSGNPFDALP